ncbi:MAG: PD-(D/E)XK motif protein [Lachnospiraceae bacterium]|nr:PD-(D/E)XK motif protein [Lachnospiraceae bacterium]
MFCLTNVFDNIMEDFCKAQYKMSNILSRRFELTGKMVVLVSAYKTQGLAEVCFSLPDINLDILKSLPKWKGMEEKVYDILDANEERKFLSFKQLGGSNRKIYFLVMQDVLEAVDGLSDEALLHKIKEILLKWNTFFQFEKEYVLSENAQQGLYGELYVLKKLINLYGQHAVNCWTGCNAEAHDFYLGKDAVEIKASSAKGPDKVRISSENQLDDTGISGKLQLVYLKVKKSEVDGETLSDIVQEIYNLIGESMKEIFQDKLLKAGYLYQMPELYNIHFKIKEESCYTVEEGFPRITPKTMCKGIGTVEYTVSLDACDRFLITIEEFYRGVNI